MHRTDKFNAVTTHTKEHQFLKRLKYLAFVLGLSAWVVLGWIPQTDNPFRQEYPDSMAAADSVEDDEESEFDAGSYSDTDYVTDRVELTGTGITNGTGTFTSQVFDLELQSSPQRLFWTPAAPYFKETPNNGGIETAYDDGNFDASDAVLLMHMNESSWSGTTDEVIDASGNANHGTGGGTATTISGGRFNRAGSFSGTVGDVVTVPHDSTLNMGTDDEVTVAGWFYFDTDIGTRFLVTKGQGAPTNNLEYRLLTLDGGIFGFNDAPFFQISSDGAAASVQAFSNTALASLKDQWVFLAATYDGSDLRLYVNDTAVATVSSSVSIFEDTQPMGIGAQDDGSFPIDGRVDEVMVFDRGLTPAEIDDLYERGALRLKYQVRSCDDPACVGETFTGPDGTAATFYSEETNPTLGFPNIQLGNHDQHRYVQYEATFETDDGVDTPELQSAGITFTAPTGSPIKHVFPKNLSLQVANGAACVPSRHVILEADGDDVRDIIVSENDRFLGTDWEFFTEPYLKMLSLPPGDGLKTIYALFRSESSDKSDVLTTEVILDEENQCQMPLPMLEEPTEEPPIDVPEIVDVPEPGPACDVSCDRFAYHLYLVNEDGTERHMGSEFAMVEPLSEQNTRIRFEDGIDMDFDDVWVRINDADCTQLIASVERVNAAKTHRIRLRLFDGEQAKTDLVLFENSHAARFRTRIIRPEDIPAYCAEETLLPFAHLDVERPAETPSPIASEPAPISRDCSSSTEFTNYLFRDIVGEEVRALQTLLQCLGYFPAEINPTGQYGPVTIDAVEAFQRANGIDPLGVVGPSTRAALNQF